MGLVGVGRAMPKTPSQVRAFVRRVVLIGVENQYYSGWTWNNYANINEDGNGTTNDTDVSMFRYKDNVLVVNGPPEPCSAIGM